jgi:hypothetical protein
MLEAKKETDLKAVGQWKQTWDRAIVLLSLNECKPGVLTLSVSSGVVFGDAIPNIGIMYQIFLANSIYSPNSKEQRYVPSNPESTLDYIYNSSQSHQNHWPPYYSHHVSLPRYSSRGLRDCWTCRAH